MILIYFFVTYTFYCHQHHKSATPAATKKERNEKQNQKSQIIHFAICLPLFGIQIVIFYYLSKMRAVRESRPPCRRLSHIILSLSVSLRQETETLNAQ